MSLLPIFLKLAGRRCLLVGAGNVALDKIRSLLKTGLQLRVVAPDALPEVRQLAAEGKIEWIERRFELSDLDGNYLVIAATDSPEVNAAVYRGAVERGILCNSVDDIPNCDFFFGSVVRRGDLQIAISTAGESPAFAQHLRREIDKLLPEDLGPGLRIWVNCAARFSKRFLAARIANFCCISWHSVQSFLPNPLRRMTGNHSTGEDRFPTRSAEKSGMDGARKLQCFSR